MSPSSGPPAIDYRPFGRHPDRVSAIGLGGYHLGKPKTVAEAVRIVHEAIDAGINFLDNAWEYHDGESERRMGRAIADRRGSVFLMTKVCTHGRDAKVAMRQLDESLRRLRTDYLDLWQIHECVYDNDPDRHYAKGGVVEALERARAQGKVRYVGFTGHKDPEIHLRMLSFGLPYDACQLPLNGFDADFRSFQHRVLPELERQKIAAIGMKSLGGRVIKKKAARVADALRYAMSLPVCTTVSGIPATPRIEPGRGRPVGSIRRDPTCQRLHAFERLATDLSFHANVYLRAGGVRKAQPQEHDDRAASEPHRPPRPI